MGSLRKERRRHRLRRRAQHWHPNRHGLSPKVITSHDTAVRGLEICGAEVIGQMLPGLVSVLRPVNASEA
jgi:hypothetical protein